MKKLIALLLLSSSCWAGTITTSFNPLGTITISTNPTLSPSNWVFVQSSAPVQPGGGCNAIPMTMTVNAGDLLVLGCSMYTGNTAGTVTDSVGDVWHTAISSTAAQLASGSLAGMVIYYSSNAVGGATTVTPNESGCNGTTLCNLLEYSGQATGSSASSTFDVGSASASTSGTLYVTGPAATTQANDLAVGFSFTNGNQNLASQSGISRSTGTYPTATENIYAQDSTLSNSTVFSSTWTVGGSSTWSAIEAMFKALVP